MSSRARPASVPAEAAWSNEEQAWIHTALDDEDRQHGLFRAWLADGALAERSLYRHGQRHGLQVFYRVEPPRWAVLSRVHQDIARVELTAADGNFGARRYFDGDDQEVNERGVRVPPRPEGVSEGASYIGQSSDCWVEFSPRPAGATRVAGSRSWDAAGVLRRSRNWDGEGWSRSYHANGALAEEGQRDDNGLQHGPWRTYRDDGSWQETEHFVRGELTRRSEHIPAGRYLDARDAPKDIAAVRIDDDIPAEMRRDLVELGLL